MKPVGKIEGTVAPLPIGNIDTDQIIPARYLKVTDRSGLGEGLFSAWRSSQASDPDGGRDFVLNRPEHRDAKILLAGDNFGCGSSREHAPWALLDYGFEAVISTRFADIFSSNSLKNGLILVAVSLEVWKQLLRAVEDDPTVRVAIDVKQGTLHLPGGTTVEFEIDAFARRCLLDGVDQLEYLLNKLPEIEAWEATR